MTAHDLSLEGFGIRLAPADPADAPAAWPLTDAELWRWMTTPWAESVEALRCDARNERSARAIERLGATREGRLRRHRIAPDGSVGDTLYFSILREEWPAVRAGLERRLSE